MAKTHTAQRRCLIVERHPWETGGAQQQLQFVLSTARQFFGSGRADRIITIRGFIPPAVATVIRQNVTISREYQNGTRRTNSFPQMGNIPASFVFFEETATPNEYDFWWPIDTAIVAARYHGWVQGRDSQYGRGRLSIIVDAPVPRLITRLTP